jgi:hypothetical protein
LLINFQNEFTSPGGKLHDDVKEVMESNGMLSKVPKVLSSARYVSTTRRVIIIVRFRRLTLFVQYFS